ncbi:MAG: NADP-dependent malic enzyme [Planctomycetaceae bacterium]|nr:NADP-dependent malic enzyme [Planctomycetaceae bacterium]
MSPPATSPITDQEINRRAVEWHRRYRGKLQVVSKVPVRDRHDFEIWYTPGVAAACRSIREEPGQVFEQTNRGNLVAIVSDGSRVLGLGDIGPEAGLPVMEGKALLFKCLGGVDAVPLCVRTRSEGELIRFVEQVEPSFGGINLEDIAQPKCFRVLDSLRESLSIPVWHDDQQGTATVVLAGLWNSLEVTGRSLAEARLALVGAGVANVATYRLLVAAGATPSRIVACDTRGTLHCGRDDIERQAETFPDKWRLCRESNGDGIRGSIAEALEGADVCLAFSRNGPDVIRPEWISRMARDAIVFACANPVPEVWPDAARQAGARVVATGRGDFPNQVNNSLAFPAIFRGALDVRARAITDGMSLAAARELAQAAKDRGISTERIVPSMAEWEVYPRVAAAVAEQAIAEGMASLHGTRAELEQRAAQSIRHARDTLTTLMDSGSIPSF